MIPVGLISSSWCLGVGLLLRLVVVVVCPDFLFPGCSSLILRSVFGSIPFSLFLSHLFDGTSRTISILSTRVHWIRIVAILSANYICGEKSTEFVNWKFCIDNRREGHYDDTMIP